MRCHFATVATLLLLSVVSGANTTDLKATITAMPTTRQNLGMAPNSAYQSSNSEVLWIESVSKKPKDPTYPPGYRYGYDPYTMSFLSQTGIARNEFNSTDSNVNHIDQCYYDRTTGYIAELEEDSGHIGAPYYVIVRKPDGIKVWQNSTFHVHRDAYGGIGVLNGTIVMLHYPMGQRSLPNGIVDMVAFNVSNGDLLYTKKGWQQARCSSASGICVAIKKTRGSHTLKRLGGQTTSTNSQVEFAGFQASTGIKLWSHSMADSSDLSFTVGSIDGGYLVMTDSFGQLYSIKSTSGEFKPMGGLFNTFNNDHHRGPNILRVETNQNSGAAHYRVYNIPTATEIIDIEYPSGSTFLANYQTVVLAAPSATTGAAAFHFFDPWTGMSTANITIPVADLPKVPKADPFLIGYRLVIPYNSTSYAVLNGVYGGMSWGHDHAANFTGNLVYNVDSTVMWDGRHVYQFSKYQ